MQGIDHAGEDAELYALGALDETAAARVERHVRECAACARRLGEAEATVLQLVATGGREPLPRTPRFETRAARAGWPAAVAAALLLGLLPWGWDRLHSAGTEAAAQAETAMLAGHFAHAPLVAREPGVPRGKVIYSLRGGWVYVIVAPGRDALDVAAVRGGALRIVASMPAGSSTRSAFVRVDGRPNAIDLLENGRVIAAASMVYSPASPPAR